MVSQLAKVTRFDIENLGTIRSLSIYLVDTKSEMEFSNIAGYSVYYLTEDNYPMHRLFIKNGEKFDLEDFFTSATYTIFNNVIYMLQDFSVEKQIGTIDEDTKVVFLSTFNDKIEEPMNRSEFIPTLAEKVLKNWYSSSSSVESRQLACPKSPADYYEADCNDSNAPISCFTTTIDYACYERWDKLFNYYCCSLGGGGGCGAILVEDELEFDGSSIVLDLDTARTFRDIFMFPTTKGQEYIQYYDELSTTTWALDLVRGGKFNDLVDLTQTFIDAVVRLQSSTVGGTTTIVDQDFYDDSVDMINFYLSVTSDPNTISILNTIRADLDDYYMKDKNYILLDISN